MSRLNRNSILAVLAACTVFSTGARAQAIEREVTVVRVQERGFYVALGTEGGLVAGDTVVVRLRREEIASVRVVGASSESALLAWIAQAIPIKPGETLVIVLPQSAPPSEAREEEPMAQQRPSLVGNALPGRKQRGTPGGPRFRGRVMLSMTGVRSETRSSDPADESRSRRFLTPTVSFRGVLSRLPGSTSLTVHSRASYRQSSTSIIDRPGSVRIYQVSLSRILPGTPFGVQAGRFSNQFEPGSGYWDGIMIQQRARRFELGIAAGLEPDRFDEGFRSDLPKYSAHVTVRPMIGHASWMTQVSFTQMRPSNEWAKHAYFGFEQRWRVKAASFVSDMQLDRDPVTQKWIVSRLRARIELRPLDRFSFYARHTVRQPYTYWRTDQVFSYRREQSSLGVTYAPGSARIGLSVVRNVFDGSDEAFTYSANFSVVRIPVVGVGISASGSYWERQTSRTTYASFNLSRRFGNSRLQLYYSMYHAGLSRDEIRSQIFGVSGQLALARNVQLSLSGRTLVGDSLVTTSLFTSLWISF